jgi:glycosyltransferase involved in cell wall biosynthesis
MAAAITANLDVTVVMPTYNRTGLVTRALDSVRNQTRRPCKVIVVDDASSDDTVMVARKWGEEHSFPIVVEVLGKNGGAAIARNRGIELATTTYVAFLDSDDEHLPSTLETLVQALEATPQAVLSFGDAAIVTPTHHFPNGLFRPRVNLDRDSEAIGDNSPQLYRLNDAKTALLKASIIPTSATCFRRDAAISVGGMPTKFRSGEDWLFWLRLAEKGRFVFCLEDLALHYRHDDNLTHARSAEFVVREKLVAFASLLDGSLGISLNDAQRLYIKALVQEQMDEWRFHLSRLGLRAYINGLSDSKKFTGKPSLTHLISDPRSIARAAVASFFPRRSSL